MSRSIRSYLKQERQQVINRRLTQKVKGLGYWAAHDARKGRIAKSKDVIKAAIVEATKSG